MKRLFENVLSVLIVMALLSLASCSSSKKKDVMEGMESDAMTLAAKINIGWNLGNALEVPLGEGGETGWGNPKTTKELIDLVKASGFNAVRIPCAWDSYADDSLRVISPEWMARVKEVVDYCIDNELYAILNIHWDGGWLENNSTIDKLEAVNQQQCDFWMQIADYFKDYDEHLLFAGCNEPNISRYEGAEKSRQGMSILKAYEQSFVNVVRATGGRNKYRNLIVQGPHADIDCTEQFYGEMPKDIVPNRLMMEVHCYTPWNFCGMKKDESWGKSYYFWGKDYHKEGSERNAEWGEEEDIKKMFQKMKTLFVDKGVPVILGEYGAIRRESEELGNNKEKIELHRLSRAYYVRFVTEQAKNCGMVPFYWDNGYLDFGIFDRKEYKVTEPEILQALMEGAKAGCYPY